MKRPMDGAGARPHDKQPRDPAVGGNPFVSIVRHLCGLRAVAAELPLASFLAYEVAGGCESPRPAISERGRRTARGLAPGFGWGGTDATATLRRRFAEVWADAACARDLIRYIFERRYGWSEMSSTLSTDIASNGGIGDSGVSASAMQETNVAIDTLLKWVCTQVGITATFVGAIRALISETKNPLVRQQGHRFVYNWLLTQIRKDPPAALAAIEENFSALSALMIASLTDVWSAVRKLAGKKMARFANYLTDAQVGVLFRSFYDICLADGTSWQAKEGSVLGITCLLRCFDLRTELSDSVAPSPQPPARGDAKQAGAGAGAQPPEAPAAALKAPSAGPASALTPSSLTPTAAAARKRRKAGRQMPESIARVLPGLLYKMLANPQTTTRHGAKKAFITFLSRTVSTAVGSHVETLIAKLTCSKPRAEAESAPSNPLLAVSSPPRETQRLITDPYEAEGLLSLCYALLCILPPRFVIDRWSGFFNAFERYLAHAASTVRQAASSLIVSLVKRVPGAGLRGCVTRVAFQSIVARWGLRRGQPRPTRTSRLNTDVDAAVHSSLPPSDVSGLLLDIKRRGGSGSKKGGRRLSLSPPAMRGSVQNRTLKHTWEWKEGRLLAMELLLEFLISEHTAAVARPSRARFSPLSRPYALFKRSSKLRGPPGRVSPKPGAKFPGVQSWSERASSGRVFRWDHVPDNAEVRSTDPAAGTSGAEQAGQESQPSLSAPVSTSSERERAALKQAAEGRPPRVLRMRSTPGGTVAGPKLEFVESRRTPPHIKITMRRTSPEDKQHQKGSADAKKRPLTPPPNRSTRHMTRSSVLESLSRSGAAAQTPAEVEQWLWGEIPVPRIDRTTVAGMLACSRRWGAAAAGHWEPIVPAGARRSVKEFGTILFTTLRQATACTFDLRWELRRMADQVLPLAVQCLMWFDFALFDATWKAGLASRAAFFQCMACLSIKFSMRTVLEFRRHVRTAAGTPRATASSRAMDATRALVARFEECAPAAVERVHALSKRPASKRLGTLSIEILIIALAAFRKGIVGSARRAVSASVLASLREVSAAVRGNGGQKATRGRRGAGTAPIQRQHRALQERVEQWLVSCVHDFLKLFMAGLSLFDMAAMAPLLLGYLSRYDEQDVQQHIIEALTMFFNRPQKILKYARKCARSTDAYATPPPSPGLEGRQGVAPPSPSGSNGSTGSTCVLESLAEKTIAVALRMLATTEQLEHVKAVFALLLGVFRSLPDLKLAPPVLSAIARSKPALSAVAQANTRSPDRRKSLLKKPLSLQIYAGNDIKEGLLTPARVPREADGFRSIGQSGAVVPLLSVDEKEGSTEGSDPADVDEEEDSEDCSSDWDDTDDETDVDLIAAEYSKFLHDMAALHRGAGGEGLLDASSVSEFADALFETDGGPDGNLILYDARSNTAGAGSAEGVFYPAQFKVASFATVIKRMSESDAFALKLLLEK